VILELQVSDLVDQQRFECGVEERECLKELEVVREFVAVDEQSGGEEAAEETESAGKRVGDRGKRRT
jgi:hypothetical protein